MKSKWSQHWLLFTMLLAQTNGAQAEWYVYIEPGKAANTFSRNMVGMLGCNDLTSFSPAYISMLQEGIKHGLSYTKFKAILEDYADNRTQGSYGSSYQFIRSRILSIADFAFKNPNIDFSNNIVLQDKLKAIQEEAIAKKFKCEFEPEIRKAILVDDEQNFAPKTTKEEHPSPSPIAPLSSVSDEEGPKMSENISIFDDPVKEGLPAPEAPPTDEIKEEFVGPPAPPPVQAQNHRVITDIRPHQAPGVLPLAEETKPTPTPPPVQARYNVSPERLAQLKLNSNLRLALEEDDEIGAFHALKSGAQVHDPESAMQPLQVALRERRAAMIEELVKRGAPTNGSIMQMIRQINAGYNASGVMSIYREQAKRAHLNQGFAIIDFLLSKGATISSEEATLYKKDIERFISENSSMFSSPSILGAHLIDLGFDNHFWFPPLKASRVLHSKIKALNNDPWGVLKEETNEELLRLLMEKTPKMDLRNFEYKIDIKNLKSQINCNEKKLYLVAKVDGIVESLEMKAKDYPMCLSWEKQLSDAKNSAKRENEILLKDGLRIIVVNSEISEENSPKPEPQSPVKEVPPH